MKVVFLDSNVLLSALIGGRESAPQVLVDLASRSSLATLVTGTCCIKEVASVLARKLPAIAPEFERFMEAARVEVVRCPRHGIAGINPKDASIVAAAVAAKADYFVTGDKRLLIELRKLTAIDCDPVTPRELLDRLLSSIVTSQ